MRFDFYRKMLRAAFEKIGLDTHRDKFFTDIDSYFSIRTANGPIVFFFELQKDGLSILDSVRFYSEYEKYPQLVEPTHGMPSWVMSPFSEKKEPHTLCPVCACRDMKIFGERVKCCSCNTEFNLSFKMFFS